MNEMHHRLAGEGLVVLAVSLDLKVSDAHDFLRVTPAKFSVVLDPSSTTPKAYGVKAMPSSFLIGRDGIVMLQHVGFRLADTATLESAIRSALATKGQP
jgi:peroxiredoxin